VELLFFRLCSHIPHRLLFEQDGGQKQVLLRHIGKGTMATIDEDVDVRGNG